MQFFYLQGERETPIVFTDPDGQALFELIVVEPEVKDIPDTHIYVVSDDQLQLIAQAINSQFSGQINIKAFSGQFMKDNNLIKPRLLGKSILYGKDLVTNMPLSDAIAAWKDDDKEGISIAVLGGYGSDFTRALISSSVMANALMEIEDAGFTMGVDSYIEKNNPDTAKIGPYLQPLNTVQGYPVSMNFLNGYDAIYVSDEKGMIELGIESADNYHDFYAEIFGIKKYSYRNMFFINQTTRNTLEQTLINLKETPDQKVILVDFSKMSGEFASSLAADVSRRFPGAMLVTLAPIELSNDVPVLNLMHLTSDLSNLGCLVSLVDGIIGANSFYIHLGASYGIPTVVMTRSKSKSGMYQYYQHVEVLLDMDDLFSDSDKTVMKEMDRFEKSFKGLWEMFDQSKAEQEKAMLEEGIQPSPNVSASEQEVKTEEELAAKPGRPWLKWLLWGIAGVTAGVGSAYFLV